MFYYEELTFEKLCTLEKDDYLEKTLNFYEDSEGEMFEIFYNEESIGILILGTFENDIFIDYFQIFKSKRKNGFGKKFVLEFIKTLKSQNDNGFENICLTPLIHSISFWSKCGFVEHLECDDMMYCKL